MRQSDCAFKPLPPSPYNSEETLSKCSDFLGGQLDSILNKINDNSSVAESVITHKKMVSRLLSFAEWNNSPASILPLSLSHTLSNIDITNVYIVIDIILYRD